MKQLTKDQLIDLVFDMDVEITKLNSEKLKERVSNIVKESGNNGWKMLVDFVVACGCEVKRECYQTFAEILYDILYSE